MDDIDLKPKLLRLLVREYIPDEKHPFRNPSDLSFAVSAIKTHKLLSEYAPQSTNKDLLDVWKSAVDSWVNRLLTLISSSMSDKCWAGICLLGVTCQDCSSERFLTSYSDWYNKLFSHIQSPAESPFVKAASCASVSDLLTRLSGFPSTKKDGTSQATKLVQPLLKLLNEDNSDVFWEEALCLLCIIMNLFPSSVHRHQDSIEAALVLNIMSGKCSPSILKKLGNALCLLPKSKGDEDSWSSMMLKILLSINNQLNDAFQGLEDEARSNETMRILLPPGKEPPQTLGGQEVSVEASSVAMRRPEQLFVSRISTLLYCCCTMLTNSYPVPVPVPVRAVVSIAGRVLLVDGSMSQASYPSMSIMKQELICSELPLLQLHSLEMLSAIVKGLRSQVSSHVGDIIRLLTEYFSRCRLPVLRRKVYSILENLLLSMGVGVAIHLSQLVVTNVFLDFCDKSQGKSMTQCRQRKRKLARTTEPLQEQNDRNGLEVDVPHNSTEISVKLAALEALEALLSVGGSFRSESWRLDVDDLLITVATKAREGGWAKEDRIKFCDDPAPLWAQFQLAALRALLASLLSPGRVRPPHLSLGLELFQRGMRGTGSRVAEFCRHALLTLEVLIHPRALPWVDLSSSVDDFEDLNRKVPGNVTFQTTMLGKDISEPESDDDLYKSWLENDDEMEEDTATKRQRNTTYTGELSSAVRDPSPVKLLIESEPGVSASGAPERIIVDSNVMVDLRETENTDGDQNGDYVPNQEDGDYTNTRVSDVHGNAVPYPMDAKMVIPDNDTAMKADAAVTVIQEENVEKNMSEAKDGEFSNITERMSARLSNLGKGRLSDDSDSADPIPDIIDEDPDSD